MGDDEIEDDPIPLPPGAHVRMLAPNLALIALERPEPEMPEALTDAEQGVALELFCGATNQEIAAARDVSVKTVSNQLEAIYRKLGVASRAELTLLLRRTRRADEATD
jgi:DNA-binding NarL/FixJ family response regulator